MAAENAVFIDTHIHLDDGRYDEDRNDVIQDAKSMGVKYMICSASDLESSKQAMALAENSDGIYFTGGCHPHEAKSVTSELFDWLRKARRHGKFAAIGEIGLDYYYDLSPKEEQKAVFAEQIALANELGCPIVVHDRDAHGDTLDILKAEGADRNGGVLHCFSGSWEIAKRCIDMGFYISFAGPITFNNAAKLREVAAKVPIDRLLSETDGPYLTPVPYRGRRNEPKHVVKIAEKLAELKGVSVETMAGTILSNAAKIFGLADIVI
jgi:TatD DNase family protein